MRFYDQKYIQKRNQWWKEGSKLVHEANYAEAVEYCKEGMRKFPSDVVVKFRFYALTCDYLIGESKRDTDEFKEALKQLKYCLSQDLGSSLMGKGPYEK